MAGNSNQPRCGVCENKLVKNGKTSAGRTRWRCKHCGASQTQARSDVSRKAEFTAFLRWLTSNSGVNNQPIPQATFRRRTQWCWDVSPSLVTTGEIHDQIMLDGTYFNGWCVLIAYTGTHVIDWQWTDREKRASWTALLERIPAPTVAIIDGNGPLKTTITKLWPDTSIQRCHFHIRQAIHKHLTRQPVLPANRELLALVKALNTVTSLDEAAAWSAEFVSWEAKWKTFLSHRTYARDGGMRPSHVRTSQKWWYTHLRSRRAWKLIAGLIRDEELFTWLHIAKDGLTIAKTTSPLEGAPNKAIKDLLRNHRGLSEDHARRAVDWLLYQHTENPKDPWSFARPEHWQPSKKPQPTIDNEPIGPALFDTAFSAEDGNGIQRGWGGRSR